MRTNMTESYKAMIRKLSGQTVLVVDNEETNVASIKGMLEPTAVVNVCEDSNDAIRLVQNGQPNLIMINLDLETGDGQKTAGLKLSSAIKQLEAFQLISQVPVLLYANEDSTETQERFFMSSGDLLVISPVDEKKFVESISKHSFYAFITQPE